MLEKRDIENYLVDEVGPTLGGVLPNVTNLDGSNALHVCAKEKDPTGWEGLNEFLGWYENAGLGDNVHWINQGNHEGGAPALSYCLGTPQ